MLSDLSPTARRALLAHGLWALGLAVADAFVNVYIFRLSSPGQGIHLVAGFQIWRNIFVPVGFWLATLLARRTSTAWAYRAGIGTYLAFYLAVLGFGERSVQVLPLLGVLLGLAMGVYWLGWQVLILDLTRDRERDRFFSAANLLLGMAGMVGGPTAGWFLSRFTGVEGYSWLFAAAALIFMASAMVSMPLESLKLPWASHLGRLWRVAYRTPDWRRLMLSCVLSVFRDGAFLFLIGLLFYVVTGSEAKMGAFGMLVSGLGLAGAWLAGAVTRPENRVQRMAQGAVAVTLAILILAWKVDLTTLVVYGCVTGLMGNLFNVADIKEQVRVNVADIRGGMKWAPGGICPEPTTHAHAARHASLFITQLLSR